MHGSWHWILVKWFHFSGELMLRKAHSTSSGMARISHVSLEAKFVSAQHVYFNLLKLLSLYLPPAGFRRWTAWGSPSGRALHSTSTCRSTLLRPGDSQCRWATEHKSLSSYNAFMTCSIIRNLWLVGHPTLLIEFRHIIICIWCPIITNISGSQWCNELPADVRIAESFTSFRKRLKTQLFRVHLDSA